LVVIAQERHLAVFDHQVEAFARVGSVPDDVPQTKDVFDPLAADVGKYGLERFEIAVNVADNGSFHSAPPFWDVGLPDPRMSPALSVRIRLKTEHPLAVAKWRTPRRARSPQAPV